MGNTMLFPGNASMTERVSTNHNFESEDFTLQCWMKTVDSGALFTQPATGLSVSVNGNGSIQFTVKSGDAFQTIQSERAGFNDGNWHHVTATRSGHELSLYVNGKLLHAEQRWVKAEAAGSDGSEQFIGSLGPTAVWNDALTPSEIAKTFVQPLKGKENGLLSHHTFNENRGEMLAGLDLLSVKITVSNQSNLPLEKQPNTLKNPFYDMFPQKIDGNKVVINLVNSRETWEAITCSVTYANALGSIDIDVLKTRDVYNSGITATTGKNLIDELKVVENNALTLNANLTVDESLVLAMMKNFFNFLQTVGPKLKKDQLVTAGNNLAEMVDYNQACQIFNTYYELKPLAIVYCESTEDVQFVYTAAVANNLPIRVRSGGHDHEGECSGTDTILLDMTRIDHVRLTKPKGEKGPVYANIGPGNRFIKLTTVLAKQNVMIPHGTCATVGIAGFTMGGGWGPWTRQKGMCCEKLMGATIVLGDGSVQKLEVTDGKVPDLLWALRGGGGMSYGIVTELVIETFPLPKELIKFELHWNEYSVVKQKTANDTVGRKVLALVAAPKTTPTINILKAWEKVILSNKTPKLLGTNLQVSAKNWDQPNYDKFDANTVFHNCTMYGYWEGDQKTLNAFLKTHFKSVSNYRPQIDGEGGSKFDYGTNLMNNWDMKSYSNVKLMLQGLQGKPFPPDLEAPSPHKITSRLVNHEGLSAAGYKGLLKSLTSPLIATENEGLGLFTYITLGALAGDFYHSMPEKQKAESAFPYKDKQYTIQYQTWWNEDLAEKEEWQNNDVYKHTNRALDWMQKCRDFDIPNTSGAFISFKDSSVPTSTYFGASYERLMKIKKEFSRDPKNHFRTRKTII